MRIIVPFLFLCYTLNAQVQWVKMESYEIYPDVCTDNYGHIFIHKSNPVQKICKLDSAANLVDEVLIPSGLFIEGMASGKDNPLLLAGSFIDSFTWGDSTFYSQGKNDGILLSLNADFSLKWAWHCSNEKKDLINYLAVDPYGRIFMSGVFAGAINFQGYELKGNESGSSFIVRLSKDGLMEWITKDSTALSKKDPPDRIYERFHINSLGQPLLAGYTDRQEYIIGNEKIDFQCATQYYIAGYYIKLSEDLDYLLSGCQQHHYLSGGIALGHTSKNIFSLCHHAYGNIMTILNTENNVLSEELVYTFDWTYSHVDFLGTVNDRAYFLNSTNGNLITLLVYADGKMNEVLSLKCNGEMSGFGIFSSPQGGLILVGRHYGSVTFNNTTLGNTQTPSTIYVKLDNSSIFSGLEEVKNSKIAFYPNPCQQELSIEGVQNNSTVQISDTQGRLLKVAHIQNSKINTAELLDGMYLLSITSENNLGLYYKFVKSQ